MIAGAGSTGGILAVCIRKFGKVFRTRRLGLVPKTKEIKHEEGTFTIARYCSWPSYFWIDYGRPGTRSDEE
jgi:hypothetical protein